ncbi:(11Z)-hexadec-11-enoyl-CoA conjugase [Harpegnathos saltator]|uniref:Acyl-CoA desaturase n=1 Tax=Harpegnathos saltator TaxID=610380 RepID=E2BGQ2_HARSA|nr:(11Z)-hexadec-11-enoyl-CoA conjugase [Harpegnathos saltator]EFN85122.1 Acyl-CoA desaturase [Harpegnathos saltator]
MGDAKKPRDQPDDKTEKEEVGEEVLDEKLDTDMNYRHKYLWRRVLIHVLLHISWFIGIYTAIFHAKVATNLWMLFLGFWIAEGVSLGAHRGFCHKSFKMSAPLKIFLLILQTMSGQNSIFSWVRDHKLHHKYSDTDADPHNATRGFFFSHIGWLLVLRHPLVLEKQRQVDMSDVTSDKLFMFQYRYFLQIYFVLGVLFPVSVPMYFWNETLWSSFFVAYFVPYVTNLHIIWTINSFAHLWGSKTYDKRIKPKQSLFAWIVTAGEGGHNYHHTFPWDCRLSEYGRMGGLSSTLLEFFNYVGLAYDLKTASPSVIYGHMKRHGDATGQKRCIEAERRREREDLMEKWLTTLDC